MAWSKLPGIGAILDLLCPPRCIFCGVEWTGATPSGPVTCDTCATALARDCPRCGVCGEPTADGGECVRCRGGRGRWDGVAVLAAYSEETRPLVLRAKRPGGEAVAAGLADLLVGKHRETLEGWRIGVVVPVPMHWLRRAVRGAGAADELARGVAAALGLPFRRMLRRIRRTPMQNELPFEDRRKNVAGAFRAVGPVTGRRILLVDDVTTTGSTLAACRRALVEAGATAVYAAVVARADRGAGERDPWEDVADRGG